MNRVIFHIDVNSAYLSWTAVKLLEEGSTLDIREIPSVIGGDETKRSGVVMAASIPAKKLGVKTGETLFEARKKVPHLKNYKTDFELYEYKSNELIEYLKTITPVVEQASVDEAYLDMSNTKYLYDDLEKLAYEIKDYIYNHFGYTVNIGIANNKLCAKMASDFTKPNRVHTLYEHEVKTKMWPLDIEKQHMVGKKTSKILRALNINTIYDLAHADHNRLRHYFKNMTKELIDRANGIDNSLVGEEYIKNKSISKSKTLVQDTNDINFLKNIILEQTLNVGSQLRDMNKQVSTVSIILRTTDFKTNTYNKTLDNPTDIDNIIYKEILSLFKARYKGEQIRLIGVRLSNLTDFKIDQVSLFDEQKDHSSLKMQKVIDDITNKYGDQIIVPAKLKE